MMMAAIAVTGFTACNSGKETAKQDAENLITYVDSVESATPVYTVANWNEIEQGYQERVVKADQSMDKLEAEEKARAEETKARYAALKASYEVKIKEAEMKAATPDYRTILRNRLFGEGKIGADMKFEFVTAANIHDVYSQFVNTVAENKNSFSREDWDEIKVLYEALDTRKNAVEKDLATNDNLKIAKLKIKFAAIKSLNRGGTKIVENEKVKEAS